ncbi:DUF2255 family protein [Klebsiella quasipneumoniae]|uniref:DUF2255 family protein n=1 Tax=Klebsiella sp. GG_Kp174 TaxID=3153485 RepID=UPI00210A8660|nr:DUF2255 family protein [Klebsiella quasipneumoniae]MCZ0713035.1 DUF2255 family protein [Klebsiella quasipneumoniae]
MADTQPEAKHVVNRAGRPGAVLSKIDQAYQKKYSSSSYVSAMTGTRTRAATIEILPS